ncbi:MAG: hypothetical protein ACU85U_20980 [Gammaproteobacteria bacterium]|jgi:TPR repeat protein
MRAQYALAVCAASGNGTARDPVSAYYWMSLAAESGFPKAQHRLRILEEELSPEILKQARQRVTRNPLVARLD